MRGPAWSCPAPAAFGAADQPLCPAYCALHPSTPACAARVDKCQQPGARSKDLPDVGLVADLRRYVKLGFRIMDICGWVSSILKRLA